MNELIEKIRKAVREECERKGNVFGPAFFEQHLKAVAEYAGKLAERFGADKEIVELAAYLHDISAVRDVATLPEHPVRSAAIAREMLIGLDYPGARAERVAEAIASHASPIPLGSGPVEAVCLSNADAMAQIARPAYFLFFAFTVRKLGFDHGTHWLLDRVEANWKELAEPARELIKREYHQARAFLANVAESGREPPESGDPPGS